MSSGYHVPPSILSRLWASAKLSSSANRSSIFSPSLFLSASTSKSLLNENGRGFPVGTEGDATNPVPGKGLVHAFGVAEGDPVPVKLCFELEGVARRVNGPCVD